MPNPIEDRIQVIGSQLLKAARSEELRLTKQHSFETVLLDWCMKNQELKVRTFQFIDLFPDLVSPRSILKHLREYFPRSEDRLPKALRAALALTRPELFTKTIVSTITRSLYIRMAKLFIGGSNEKTVLKLFDEMESQGIHLSIDLLGESTTSESEAEEYFNRYQALILALGTKKLGIQKQNISIKLSALDPFFDPLGSCFVSKLLFQVFILCFENCLFGLDFRGCVFINRSCGCSNFLLQAKYFIGQIQCIAIEQHEGFYGSWNIINLFLFRFAVKHRDFCMKRLE